MKIAFAVNDVRTERSNYTTTRLARRAVELDHEVSLIGLQDFTYQPNGAIAGMARQPRRAEYKDDGALLEDLQDTDAPLEKIQLNELDVLLLRWDPADELVRRPWAPTSALLFAQLTATAGVLVLNDPTHLTDASNKTYFQRFPETMRPRTCITRERDEIVQFVEQSGGKAVIKPLQGSGGQGVFVITDGAGANLNQMIDATTRDGYAIVQEYLPLAAEGDLRLLTLGGRPFQVDGSYACLHRYNNSSDARSNVSAGGKYEIAVPSESALRLAAIASAKLIRDGMYFAGLDIVGEKMMEINVDSAGGLSMIDDLTDKDFCGAMIHDLVRRVRMYELYNKRLSNVEIASL